VQIDRHAKRALRRRHAGDVVHMRMGQQNVTDGQAIALGERHEAGHLVAWIDQHGFPRVLTADDEAVLEEGTDRLGLNYHSGRMILAVLDDLMFSSKIKTAANQLGVALAFARSAEGALTAMRNAAPSLVIFDLNNARINPLGIVAAMKEDAALASIPTLGYASHVQTDVINAARQAGVGEVLARSAFATQLGDILKR